MCPCVCVQMNKNTNTMTINKIPTILDLKEKSSF